MDHLLRLKNFIYHTEQFIIDQCSIDQKEIEKPAKFETKIDTVWKTTQIPYSYNIGSGRNCTTVNLTRTESYPVTNTHFSFTPSQYEEFTTLHIIGPSGEFVQCFNRNGSNMFKLFNENKLVTITRLLNVDFIYKFKDDKYCVQNIFTDYMTGMALTAPCIAAAIMKDLRIVPASYAGMVLAWIAIYKNA